MFGIEQRKVWLFRAFPTLLMDLGSCALLHLWRWWSVEIHVNRILRLGLAFGDTRNMLHVFTGLPLLAGKVSAHAERTAIFHECPKLSATILHMNLICDPLRHMPSLFHVPNTSRWYGVSATEPSAAKLNRAPNHVLLRVAQWLHSNPAREGSTQLLNPAQLIGADRAAMSIVLGRDRSHRESASGVLNLLLTKVARRAASSILPQGGQSHSGVSFKHLLPTITISRSNSYTFSPHLFDTGMLSLVELSGNLRANPLNLDQNKSKEASSICGALGRGLVPASETLSVSAREFAQLCGSVWALHCRSEGVSVSPGKLIWEKGKGWVFHKSPHAQYIVVMASYLLLLILICHTAGFCDSGAVETVTDVVVAERANAAVDGLEVGVELLSMPKDGWVACGMALSAVVVFGQAGCRAINQYPYNFPAYNQYYLIAIAEILPLLLGGVGWASVSPQLSSLQPLTPTMDDRDASRLAARCLLVLLALALYRQISGPWAPPADEEKPVLSWHTCESDHIHPYPLATHH
ncbi:uncharacterized protein MYCFIDRAFT_173332 [Pseudocercospora fijiensis CIRAD86]|uniref:Uncharacterized protein n=1 Tax=Pseudocercospora fijiensis (strain CIRAD86) TaxID=383855 RepID=M3B4P5_PSEFD|nr:uncharacterized protein MYCFIDRAFT_173332 [Pseudocercospora fijiensis CIRAD86]EME84322.1 hypothetical protein MYCFIDRAFT_173332 [Pseudocercospora fijiensis CIRAD86]